MNGYIFMKEMFLDIWEICVGIMWLGFICIMKSFCIGFCWVWLSGRDLIDFFFFFNIIICFFFFFIKYK